MTHTPSAPPPADPADPSPAYLAALTQVRDTAHTIRTQQAAYYQALHEAASHAPGNSSLHVRAFRAEIAALLRVSEYQVDADLSLAYTLGAEFPLMLDALRDGRISVQHARKLVQVAAPLGNVTLRVPAPGSLPPHLALELLRAQGREAEALVRVRRAQFAEVMLGHARTRTPAQLVPIGRKLVELWTVDSLTERHQWAVSLRNVRVYDCDDGMADLVAHVPVVEAYAMKDRVLRVAKLLPVEDVRSRDERCADAFVALTLGCPLPGLGGEPVAGVGALLLPQTEQSGPTKQAERAEQAGQADPVGPAELREAADAALARALAVKGQVQLVVRVDALDAFLTTPPESDSKSDSESDSDSDSGSDRDNLPESPPGSESSLGSDKPPGSPPVRGSPLLMHAELAGYGPVTLDAVIPFLRNTPSWGIVGVHPETGAVLTTDTYRPSAHIKRLLAARDPVCRFPGCRAPVLRNDVDHTVPVAVGGETSTENLKVVCRGHHMMKHHGGWGDTQLVGGVVEWVSPAGHTYTEMPEDRIMEDHVPEHLLPDLEGVRTAQARLHGLIRSWRATYEVPVSGDDRVKYTSDTSDITDTGDTTSRGRKGSRDDTGDAGSTARAAGAGRVSRAALRLWKLVWQRKQQRYEGEAQRDANAQGEADALRDTGRQQGPRGRSGKVRFMPSPESDASDTGEVGGTRGGTTAPGRYIDDYDENNHPF